MIAEQMMRQQFDLANDGWRRGVLGDFMAGYHVGAITAFSLVDCTQETFDLAAELINKIHELKRNQSVFQSDTTEWGTA